MDKDLLKKYFQEYGYEANFINYSEINFRKGYLKNQFILYTSSEDKGDLYTARVFAHGLEEFATVHDRHHDVGNDQIRLTLAKSL